MEMNWSILGWIVGLIFAYLIGVFEGRYTGSKKAKEEAKQKKDGPAPEAGPATVKVDDPGLLRVKNENGRLTLDLDGSRVDVSALSADQRKRLNEMVAAMRPWLEGKPAFTPATLTPLHPQPRPNPIVTAPPLPTPQAAMEPIPSRPITSSILSSILSPKPATIAKEDRPASAPTSMVGQIDQILQSRLDGTSLQERGIFLTESPEGGVMVYIGLTKYMGIDDVPDAEIKATIRAAISEWEKKYTPGL